MSIELKLSAPSKVGIIFEKGVLNQNDINKFRRYGLEKISDNFFLSSKTYTTLEQLNEAVGRYYKNMDIISYIPKIIIPNTQLFNTCILTISGEFSNMADGNNYSLKAVTLPTISTQLPNALDRFIEELEMFDLYFYKFSKIKYFTYEHRDPILKHDKLSHIILNHNEGNITEVIFKYDFNYMANPSGIDYSGYPKELHGLTLIQLRRADTSEIFIYSVSEFDQEILKMFNELNKHLT